MRRNEKSSASGSERGLARPRRPQRAHDRRHAEQRRHSDEPTTSGQRSQRHTARAAPPARGRGAVGRARAAAALHSERSTARSGRSSAGSPKSGQPEAGPSAGSPGCVS